MAAYTSQPNNMFATAVNQILKSWPSLLLAVEQGFGGPESKEKAEWMSTAIDAWFRENDGLYADEVEDFLNDVLNTEFDLRVEDGSVIEIARQICLFYRLCKENNESEIERRLQALPKPNTSTFKHAVEEEMQDVESDDGDELLSRSSLTSQPNQSQCSSSTSQPPADASEEMDAEEEDGWKVIRKGRKSNR